MVHPIKNCILILLKACFHITWSQTSETLALVNESTDGFFHFVGERSVLLSTNARKCCCIDLEAATVDFIMVFKNHCSRISRFLAQCVYGMSYKKVKVSLQTKVLLGRATRVSWRYKVILHYLFSRTVDFWSLKSELPWDFLGLCSQATQKVWY